MAEPEGTAEIESPASDMVASAASARADAADDDLGVDAGAVAGLSDVSVGDEEEPPPEPERRRLVAELLEGDDSSEQAPDTGSQLVAPPLHAESVDTGQPIYQLDLSSDEPQGVILAAEPYGDMASVAVPPQHVDSYGADGPAYSGAHEAVKGMIVNRERRVMAAERDGIGAYDLAVELDDFVRSLVLALRQVGG